MGSYYAKRNETKTVKHEKFPAISVVAEMKGRRETDYGAE